jgi:TonB family protein
MGRSVALSIGIHALFAAMVVVLALWLDRVTFSKSSSVQQSGPAPEQAVTMNLVPEPRPPTKPKLPQPQPTPEPGLPVLPVIQPFPKPPVTVTIVPPAPAPAPKAAPPLVTAIKPPNPTPSPVKATAKPNNKPLPKYVAANATGQGTAPDISSQQLAKLGYPAPNYPPQAQSMHETGTVLMEVGFGPDGSVTNAQVRQSSGFSLLDMSTRSFIRVHWKDLARANTTVWVPITYTLK